MKKVLFFILSFTAFKASADYSCTAYCGYYSNRILLVYTDTEGEHLAGSGRGLKDAWNDLKDQCEDIDDDYALYVDTSYRTYATPQNSCSRD